MRLIVCSFLVTDSFLAQNNLSDCYKICVYKHFLRAAVWTTGQMIVWYIYRGVYPKVCLVSQSNMQMWVLAYNEMSGLIYTGDCSQHGAVCSHQDIRASIHEADGRLTARSQEVSKPRDSGLDFSDRSEIWQAPRQERCRYACHISERYDHDIQSRGFETSRALAVRHPSTRWTEAQYIYQQLWKSISYMKIHRYTHGFENYVVKTIIAPLYQHIISCQWLQTYLTVFSHSLWTTPEHISFVDSLYVQ